MQTVPLSKDQTESAAFLERLTIVEVKVEERNSHYDTRFKAAEAAVEKALAAQEKATAANFAANEKAITKAEDAQRDYNIRSNEFRGQLDDQAKTLMPRSEATVMFNGLEGKISDFRNTSEGDRASIKQTASERADNVNKQIAALNLLMSNFLPIKDYEKGRDELRFEIASLRESRSSVAGKDAGANAIVGYIAIAIAAVAGVLAITSRFIP